MTEVVVAPQLATLDIPEELDQAFKRVNVVESLTYTKLLEKIKALKNAQNSLKASQILARKELLNASKYGIQKKELSDEKQRYEELRTKEKEDLDQYHKALLSHALLASSIQDAVFQTQIENNFFDCLEEGSESDPKIRSILTNYNDNMNVSSDLTVMYKTCEQIEKDIIELRIKYRETLKTIDHKWKVVTGLEPPSYKYRENQQAKSVEERLHRRESRLDLMIGLLQGLITSSGEVWGANPRLVQILLLCDSSHSYSGNSSVIKETIRDLRGCRKKEEDEEVKAKSRGIGRFLTSTPKVS